MLPPQGKIACQGRKEEIHHHEPGDHGETPLVKSHMGGVAGVASGQDPGVDPGGAGAGGDGVTGPGPLPAAVGRHAGGLSVGGRDRCNGEKRSTFSRSNVARCTFNVLTLYVQRATLCA